LATAKVRESGVYAYVTPVIISKEHPLSVVNDVYNAIYVKGNVIGEIMFYGKGAGKMPTASAVVADVVDALKHLNKNIMHFWSNEKHNCLSIDSLITRKLIRAEMNDYLTACLSIEKIFGDVRLLNIYDNEIGFVSDEYTEAELSDKINAVKSADGIKRIANVIGIEGEI
jgi:homoserine dehydrogenase